MNATHLEFSPQRSARIAGLLYLTVIVSGFSAEIFARQRLIVGNDPVATAGNILANESMFRWGFAADLVAALCVVPLVMLLYELLKVVNARIALLAVLFSLVGIAVQSTALLGHFAPIVLLKRGVTFGVDPGLLRAQAYMALQLQGIGYAVALAFFGGTMIARGYLIVRSTFLPRTIGALLTVAGVCYLTNSFVDFLAPGLAPYAMALLMIPVIAETSLALWLTLKGVGRSYPSAA